MADSPITFYLNGKYIYCQYYAADDRLQMGINLKVDPALYKAKKLPKHQRAVMSRIEVDVVGYEADCNMAGRATSAAAVEKIVLQAIGKTASKKTGSRRETFLQLYTRYLSDAKTGKILHDGKKYSPSFVAIASVVQNKHLENTILAITPADAVREDHLRQYGADLTAKGLAKNTVATYMDPVLSILNGARRIGWYKGAMLDTKAFRVGREDVDHGVYLPPAEMEKIAKLELEGDHSVWRDAFLLGCWLGMRHSDLCRLTPQHRQGDLVNINTTKTDTPVWVPLSPAAREIWDRRQGVLNVPGKDPFCEFAKELGRKAKLDKEILFSRTEGGKKADRWVAKCELMGTHTMRRSFATNAYRAKVDMLSIMKVTGHKSTANFLKYIRLNDEEHAEMLLEHPHFK